MNNSKESFLYLKKVYISIALVCFLGWGFLMTSLNVDIIGLL